MVVMDELPKWREGLEALVCTLVHQFTAQERILMGGQVPVTLFDPEAHKSFLFHLRKAVKMVVNSHDVEFADESVWEPCVSKTVTQEEAKTVCIRGKEGMKRDEAGRPVMELVFDTRPFSEMPGGQLQGRHRNINGTVEYNMAYTGLLHELLVRNSTLIEPSQRQKQTVQKFPAYTPSFLTSLDSCGADALGHFSFETALMEKLNLSLISLSYGNLKY